MKIMNENTFELIKKFALAFTAGGGVILGQWALKKATHQPDDALVVNINQFLTDKEGKNIKPVDKTKKK